MAIIGKETAITGLAIVAAVAVVLIIAGVGHPIQPYYSYAQPATPFKVVFVTDAKFNDGGWGAVGFNATQAMKSKFGVALTSADSIAIPDIESILTGYADAGANLIIAQGF